MAPSISWLVSLALATPLLVSAMPAAASGCNELSADQAQTIPGWATLKSTAEKNWGTGKYYVKTNEEDYPDQPATNCNGVAKGWVWFDYTDPVQGHYKWSLNMETVLPNDADRKVA
ncbi:hypothetical protein B0H13DRAFT_1895997 [Mycena leptocephala]|nr:hypothetical protein B0H13DRAFT_1895997 [Mycena leptocephala]